MMQNRNSQTFSLLALLTVCLAFGASPAPAQITGKVVAVADGDTITVRPEGEPQIRVRLAGIDAPERRQDFSDKAKTFLSDRVFGKVVTLEGTKKDRWGRLLAKVIVDGKDIGLELVKNGLAWHFKRYQHEQSKEDRKLYAAAEDEARQKRVNIWSQPDPVPPWEFRARP